MLTAQHSEAATKHWRHAQSCVKCLSVPVYASLSSKVFLDTENTELHTEHFECKSTTALSITGPPGMFFLTEERSEPLVEFGILASKMHSAMGL